MVLFTQAGSNQLDGLITGMTLRGQPVKLGDDPLVVVTFVIFGMLINEDTLRGFLDLGESNLIPQDGGKAGEGFNRCKEVVTTVSRKEDPDLDTVLIVMNDLERISEKG